METYFAEMDSPVGRLTLVASIEALQAILWEGDVRASEFVRSENNPIILEAQKQLREYFAGQRKIFDLPLAPRGTAFQNQAWQQLLQIPYGETISYGEQALRLGDKNKARAVGMANGQNPISIVIPCHRVIGKNGALVGFGGGLDVKAWLLAHERAMNS